MPCRAAHYHFKLSLLVWVHPLKFYFNHHPKNDHVWSLCLQKLMASDYGHKVAVSTFWKMGEADRHVSWTRGNRSTLDLGKSHSSETFQGREIGKVQRIDPIWPRSDAQKGCTPINCLQKTKQITQKWWISENRPWEMPRGNLQS